METDQDTETTTDKVADYDIEFSVDIDENAEGRSCMLWRDA